MTTDSENFKEPKTKYPGVAELVPRLVWDQEIARSNRVTRTKTPLKSLISEGFSYQKVWIFTLRLLLAVIAPATDFFFVYCDAIPEFAPIRCLLAIYTILPYNR